MVAIPILHTEDY